MKVSKHACVHVLHEHECKLTCKNMSIFAGKMKAIFDFPICSPAGLLDITVILPHNQRWAKLLQKRIADQVLSNEFSLKITLLKLI
jgi:hypothetical protein